MGDEREILPDDEREAVTGVDDVEAHLLPPEEREMAPQDEREALPASDKRDALPGV
jgi:hypothetical protein